MWRERSSSCFGLPLRSLAATHLYSCSVMDSSAWSVEKPTCGSYFHVILFRFEKKHTHTPVVSTCFVFQCFWGPTKKGFLPFGFPRRLKMAPTPTKSGKRKNRMECAEFAMRPEPSPAVEDVLVVLEERHADRRVRRPARNHQRPALQTEDARRNLQIGVNQEVLLIFLDWKQKKKKRRKFNRRDIPFPQRDRFLALEWKQNLSNYGITRRKIFLFRFGRIGLKKNREHRSIKTRRTSALLYQISRGKPVVDRNPVKPSKTR